MREIFEEYGGIIAIAILGLTIISGFVEIIVYLKELGYI